MIRFLLIDVIERYLVTKRSALVSCQQAADKMTVLGLALMIK